MFCKFKYYLASILLLVTFNVYASWYEAQGQGYVDNGDYAKAKQEAINDAIRNILLESGAVISINSNSNNGFLTEDSFQMSSQKAVKKLTVLEETRTPKTILVKVRAYIDENRLVPACKLSQIKKRILPLVFFYDDNEAYQTSIGIEDLNKELSYKIVNEITKSQALMVRPEIKANLGIKINSGALTYKDQNNLNNIAKQHISQYVLLGSIRSLAVSEVGSNALMKYLNTKTRTIDFNISLYDSFSSSFVFSKNYYGEADWEFDQGEYLNLRSDRFISSDYGSKLQNLIKEASSDIIAALECKAPSARVIETQGDDIIINIGSNSGLKEGMIFNIAHRTPIKTYDNTSYDKDMKHPLCQYKVKSCYNDAALLVPVDINSNMINVKLNDLVTLIEL